MALITNNISGSSSDSWRIGITGSVRIANPGAGAFPAMPGTDVDFFVSGSRGGKGTSGVSVFGGDTVISGTLVVGTGSVTIDSNEIRFQGGAAKIFSGSGGLTFADSSNAGVTLSSLAAGGGSVAGSDTQIQFNDGGAFGASADLKFAKTTGTMSVANLIVSGTGNSLVSSGTIRVKDGGGTTLVSLSTAGVISGSSNLQAGGDLTIAGDANVNGGDLITTAATATVFNTNATTVTIAGAATSGVTVGNATGGVTLNGTATVTGDLAVNGATSADITTTTATATVFNTNATTVTVGGAATSGVTIGNSTGGVTLNGTATVTGDLAVNGATSADITTTTATATVFNTNATRVDVGGAATDLRLGGPTGTTRVNNNLFIKGDLYVSGTTTTIDSTVTEIQDPLVGFGFASGSVAGAAGDRGWIGGITGAGNNVAFVWSNSNSSFAAAKTTSAPGDASVTLSTLQPVRASSFQVGSSTSILTGSGTQLILSGNVVAVSGSSVNFSVDGTGIATVSSAGFLPQADVTYNLGSPSKRWQNIYTGDLHLRNDRGDYTLIEESDTLTIRFNKTGKRYRFVLERAPEFDEEPL